jgi:hypothetical protein
MTLAQLTSTAKNALLSDKPDKMLSPKILVAKESLRLEMANNISNNK